MINNNNSINNNNKTNNNNRIDYLIHFNKFLVNRDNNKYQMIMDLLL